MISITFVYLIIILSLSWGEMMIPFPDVTTTTWKPVLKGEHHCPSSSDVDILSRMSTLKLQVRIPTGSVASKSDGLLCHGAKWVTTCDFRWYGSKYITHSLHSIRPTLSQCTEAAKAYKEGRLMAPGFPPESCGWNSVTDSELLSILVTPHHTGVDDYRGIWIDSMFPGGECKEMVCDTVQGHTIWMSTSNLTTACGVAFKQIQGQFYYLNSGHQPNKEGTFFHSPNHPNSPLSTACRKKYCNQEGIVIHTGEWIGVPWNTRIRDVQLDSYTDLCAESTEIKSTIGSAPIRVIAWEMERVMDFALCQTVWDKVNRGDPLSPLDLSYLSSRAPGKGLAYTIINETLHVAHVRYIRTYIKAPIMEEIKGSRGDRSAAESVLWTQWFPYGDGEIGPNGLLKTNGSFKFPFYLVGMGAIDDDLIELSNADPIDHPQKAIASVHLNTDEELFFGNTGSDSNPVEAVEGWFASWKSAGINMALIVLCVLLVLIFLRSLPALIKLIHRYRVSRSRQTDVELNSINETARTGSVGPDIIPGAWRVHDSGVRQSQFFRNNPRRLGP
ncbi:glycoprotein [Vesiculovirus radi]|uniref:Glycoprotein n=1 Tax=Vesiculovirus radi TaxID=1972566 RepID=A0A0D3R1W3_9RHAB|nr:glycoprotein [Vesiculovirus radi]AJR28591.1 glycoprotein [Vesiculovirus radi]